MQAVDRFLKGRAHLHLVHHKIIVFPVLIMLLNIALQSMVFHQSFILRKVKINVDDIRILIVGLQPCRQRIQQLGLARPANTGDHLDIRCLKKILHFFQICGAFDKLHHDPSELIVASLYSFYSPKSNNS